MRCLRKNAHCRPELRKKKLGNPRRDSRGGKGATLRGKRENRKVWAVSSSAMREEKRKEEASSMPLAGEQKTKGGAGYVVQKKRGEGGGDIRQSSPFLRR